LDATTSSKDADTPFRHFAILTKEQAGVAQLVEHLICNQRVAGSIPVAGSNVFNNLRVTE
jgi:hypothetical protein